MTRENPEVLPSRVLVVDDDPNHRRTLALGLRIDGFQVDEAPDGTAGLERLAQGVYDFVLVDVMMPGMNGLEFARQAHLTHPRLRLVLMSAYHLTERQIQQAGVRPTGFIPKPYRVSEVTAFLRSKVATNERPSSPPPAP